MILAKKLLAGAGNVATELSFMEDHNRVGLTSSESFTGVSFGADQVARYILVVVHAWGNGTYVEADSCTIGGESGTVLRGANSENSGVYAGVKCFYAEPSGTSGTVSATFSSDVQAVGIGVFRIITGDINPLDSDETSSATTLTITTQDQGALLSACTAINDSVATLQTTGTPVTAYSLDVDTDDYMKGQYDATITSSYSVDGAANNATIAISWR